MDINLDINQVGAAQMATLAKTAPQLVNGVWRFIIASIRPALARMHSEVMSADALVSESLAREPASEGLNLGAMSMALVFGGTQATLRKALTAALVIHLDTFLKDVKAMTDPADFDFGPSFGSTRFTRLVRATGNHIRHVGEWRSAPGAQARRNMQRLSDAGIPDPCADDVPLQVLKLVGPTYFGLEDNLRATLQDVTAFLAPAGAETDFEKLFAGKKWHLEVTDVDSGKGFTLKLEPQKEAAVGTVSQ